MRDLVIIGAGGHGRETLDIVEAINERSPTWFLLGFLDDGIVDHERVARRGSRVLGPVSRLAELSPEVVYALAVGDGSVRRAVHSRIRSNRRAASLVHPDAVFGGDNRLGAGVLVAAGVHVTTNVTIGDHSHLNVGVSVHHDSVIGHMVTLSPRVLVNGDVHVGDHVWIGPGAILGRGITVGAGAVIGAGSVVLGDVAPGNRVAGVPARPLGDRPSLVDRAAFGVGG